MSEVPNYEPSGFPPFAVTADIVVFTIEEEALQVVVVERGVEPFKGSLALPGGFVRPEESLIEAATRELDEETGLTGPAAHLVQLGAYGDPGRDPRMRVVTVAYWAIVPDLPRPIGGDDARDAFLTPVHGLLDQPGRLAFDHPVILSDALGALRQSLEHTTVATGFLDEEFTISELRAVYEAVWGKDIDPGNFQRKVLNVEGFLESTGRQRRGTPGRPAELFRSSGLLAIDPPLHPR